MKRVLLLALCIALVLSMIACDKGEENVKLSFKAASSYEELKALDGQTVSINGYMATSSPVDGGYLFLMNLPYQSCPFCVPNTSQLSNTMAVYAKDGDSFDYTGQAIKVTGTLVVAENEEEPFTDKYGYTFNFKIVDAAYTVLTDEELTADMAAWQKIADSGLMDEMYRMYDYLNFVCKWNTYYVNSYTSISGETVPGYYLWPADAEHYLKADGSDAYDGYTGQFHYGYQEGYFDGLVAKIEALGMEETSVLVQNVRDAEALSQKALKELEDGNYTSEKKYIEMFGTEDYVYTLNKGEELAADWETVYSVFEQWLASLEM
jgi:hypothetical protein